jgi:hypothetical protein
MDQMDPKEALRKLLSILSVWGDYLSIRGERNPLYKLARYQIDSAILCCENLRWTILDASSALKDRDSLSKKLEETQDKLNHYIEECERLGNLLKKENTR